MSAIAELSSASLRCMVLAERSRRDGRLGDARFWLKRHVQRREHARRLAMQAKAVKP